MTRGTNRARGGRALGAVLVALVVAFAIGVGIAAIVVAPASPQALETPDTITAVPVGVQPFDDARSVDVGFSLGSATTLTSPGDGRVTRFACAAGDSIRSGESLLAIDGSPVLTLSTRVPLWRDLVEEDTGDDVRALQQELARLGEPVTVDGILGTETLDALERRFRAIGDTEVLEAITAMRILWIPSPSVAIDACELGTGASVAVGEPLATLAAGLAAATVEQLPDDLVPGERVLVVDGERLPLTSDGIVTDTAALATLTSSSSLREAVLGEATSFTASMELAEPVDISVVPPSAVVAIDGATGCVVAGDVARPVDIVGSQLGQTLVRFTDDAAAPPSVAVQPAESTTCG
ncbi:peptidoglycan-binding domain-containing protein [Labedella endophytica]|uniref:Peptidoglycan-binding protein n=1 Tax=Labedella endophytica TaxID=1523160 RepID=A0A3S0VAZ9_9MICO|nr:peptidoglycan-binding domain-containing protein [Labedella endophytica]RUR01106.1 peptidoglycan-binding protein [Labedella endophytica]